MSGNSLENQCTLKPVVYLLVFSLNSYIALNILFTAQGKQHKTKTTREKLAACLSLMLLSTHLYPQNSRTALGTLSGRKLFSILYDS